MKKLYITFIMTICTVVLVFIGSHVNQIINRISFLKHIQVSIINNFNSVSNHIQLLGIEHRIRPTEVSNKEYKRKFSSINKNSNSSSLKSKRTITYTLIKKDGITVDYSNGSFIIYGTLTRNPVINKNATIIFDFGYFGKAEANLPLTSKYINGKVDLNTIYSSKLSICIEYPYYMDKAKKHIDVWRTFNENVSLPSSVLINYLSPSSYVQSHNKKIVDLAEKITHGLLTDKQKSLAIHSWVAKNLKYDVKNYFNENIKDYTALDALNKRLVMCTGYANLNVALHRAIGIPARIVVGKALGGNHAWNEVKINGKWYFQDPTFDSGYVDLKTRKFIPMFTLEYFNVPTPKSHIIKGYANY